MIGAGLAGSEAAMQLARRGVAVDLYEMRPQRMTEAHTTAHCAELVCSNSFGSQAPNAASRILKDELRQLGAFVLTTAQENAVPAGASLAVDREKFSQAITLALKSHPLIQFHEEEMASLPQEGIVIVATGPLTTKPLCQSLATLLGEKSLYFYDAISPILSADSLDMNFMFRANRYDKGDTADFLNIPLTKAEYESFVDDLLTAEVVLPHDFEEEKYFEGCMPIEALAARGKKTLAFGPLKPAGLTDPKTGRWPYAAIQLRLENQHGTSYNLVGCQTKLKYKEQERIFRKLPGLKNAEFLRLGSMHRNTYLHSPKVLSPTLQLRQHPRIFIAGQLTGTEGYLESSATGLIAGVNAARLAQGESLIELPAQSMLGALLQAISEEKRENFQPMNANIGVLPPLATPVRDKAERNRQHAERSQNVISNLMSSW